VNVDRCFWRSADFQSAVSQNSILPVVHNVAVSEKQAADCKSAVQQIKNLRYDQVLNLFSPWG